MSQNPLQVKVQAFADMQILQNASLSIHVLDLDQNKTVAYYDENRSLSPASSVKVITTAVALDQLGTTFRYKTNLAHSGNIENGVLKGNLYLIGQGDPSLGSDQIQGGLNFEGLFNKLIQETKKSGINSIEGQVVVDASYFDDNSTPANYPWIDLGNYYASGVWGVNINENFYHLYFKQTPSKNGSPKVLHTIPKIPALSFQNQLKNGAANSGDNAYIFGSPYSNQKFIRGSIPLGNDQFKIKGSIPDPPLLTANTLHQKLIENGIQISQNPKVIYTPEAAKKTILYVHNSPSMLELCIRTNKKSVNVYGEALLKTLGKINHGKGSYKAGISFIKDYFDSIEIDSKGFYLKDGSGLSLNNGVTSKQFTKLLYHVYCNKDLYPIFKNTLVEMEDGIFLKSGSMERVRSYTGYMNTNQEKPLAFSIIVNNYDGPSTPLVKAMKSLIRSLK